MYSLSCLGELYEMGLVGGGSGDVQGFYQYVLMSMCRVTRATGAGLLLYQAEWQRLVPGAMQNLSVPYHRLITAIDCVEMEALARQGPGETLVSLVVDQQRVGVVTLSCRGALYGVVALSGVNEDCLLDERGMLLCYMGQVAALVLAQHGARSSEVQAAISQERGRIARDLHDGPAQQLALALLKLEYVQYSLDADSSSEPTVAAGVLAEVQGVRRLVEASLDELRRDVASLLPVELERESFSGALQRLVYGYQEQHPEVGISYEADDLEGVPELLEVPIFRLMQEALSNVYKHARATHVDVCIRKVPGALEVEVGDNGVGFERSLQLVGADLSRPIPDLSGGAAQADKSAVGCDKSAPIGRESGVHVGLYSMCERVEAVGGIWEIESRSGGGTIIRARFSLG
jgi:signal transduction histidine kinase